MWSERRQTQRSTVKSHLCQAPKQATPICDVRSQDSGSFVGVSNRERQEGFSGARDVLILCLAPLTWMWTHWAVHRWTRFCMNVLFELSFLKKGPECNLWKKCDRKNNSCVPTTRKTLRVSVTEWYPPPPRLGGEESEVRRHDFQSYSVICCWKSLGSLAPLHLTFSAAEQMGWNRLHDLGEKIPPSYLFQWRWNRISCSSCLSSDLLIEEWSSSLVSS